ncbi:MAG: hypothetical protein RIC89_08315 [Pseudomonadales bacterium]
MHGTGTFVWANKDRYEGDFVEGRRVGMGQFTWASGAQYSGQFQDGLMHGQGIYRWLDGRTYTGQFVRGAKHGEGRLAWSNGNQYHGQFVDDQRSGDGVFFWRDGTIYRGTFIDGKMDGWGVKRTAEGQRELQQWQLGTLVQTKTIREYPRCRFTFRERAWMVESNECINGLAHGRGIAASLDGDLVIAEARFVLGRLVSGEPRVLPTAGIELDQG